MVVDLKSWDPRTTFNTANTIADIGDTANEISGNGGTDASAYGSASLVYDAGFVDDHVFDEDGNGTTGVNEGLGDGTRQAEENDEEDGVVTSDSTATNKDKYIDITTSANAAALVKQIDTAVTAAASERAKLGAYINRLEYAADNLANVAQNTDASRSRIEDADYAEETSELARTQIISQASTAMLAQANQVKQSVLALLQ
jgi:flagellin